MTNTQTQPTLPTTEQVENLEAVKDPNVITVNFDHGYKRGEKLIKEVVIRKPKSRALRGLSLVNLLQLDIDSIAKVASRISLPTMSENDVFELDPADLTKLGKEIISFFVDTKDEFQ
ncbi:phage tail assembly protein [Acinetobacter dispersus]|uniref:phage tail assembly protein n=1 Tax=Acinetobacter dispersus TaxID=70348 RepID=UPI00132F07B0|nr:phage tail assembly protein [Acinetobacter dispersus]QHH99229.1 phage tail assembly protein [Acinetobacter dispersus]